MKTITFLMVALLACMAVKAQIQVRQIGKVHYSVIPSNADITLRNDSIAAEVNNYIVRNATKNFPDVLLYITDQNLQNNLSNFEQVLVYYQKYQGEFFNRYDNIYGYGDSHIGITLSLFKNHGSKAMAAIKYAIDNFQNLRQTEKRLSKKKKKGMLTDEDLEIFNWGKKQKSANHWEYPLFVQLAFASAGLPTCA